MTLASTSRPSIAGLPTLISLPSLNSRTRPSLTEEPGSAARRSTRIWSPGATRYCLPPLTMTADSELSGLGTARDSTKPLGTNFSRPLPVYGEGKGGALWEKATRLTATPMTPDPSPSMGKATSLRATTTTPDPSPFTGRAREGPVSNNYRISTEVATTIAITRPANGVTARAYNPRTPASPRRRMNTPRPIATAATRNVIPKKRTKPSASSAGGGTNRVVNSPQYG